MDDFNQNDFLLDSDKDVLLEQREAQSIPKGIAAGLIAAILGGILWGVITYLTNYQIGYIAVAIGYMVGYAVRTYGKGIDAVFSYIGAGLALLGCFFGKMLTIILLLSKTGDYNIDFVTGLTMFFNPEFISMVITRGFEFMDLLFYAIAGYEGFRFARIVVE